MPVGLSWGVMAGVVFLSWYHIRLHLRNDADTQILGDSHQIQEGFRALGY